MRISRGHPAPAFAGRTRVRSGGLSRPLEARDRSRANGSGLFEASLDNGKTTWARPQGGRDRNTYAGTTGPGASDGYGIARQGSSRAHGLVNCLYMIMHVIGYRGTSIRAHGGGR